MRKRSCSKWKIGSKPLKSRSRIYSVVVCAVLFTAFTVHAETPEEYQAQTKQLLERASALSERIAALERARAAAVIPPAKNNEEVKAATVRIVIEQRSSVDVGNMRYGSASIFSCVSNPAGGFTAYALTAAHVVGPNESFFVDKGGRNNIAVGDHERTILSPQFENLFQDGGVFQGRNPSDPSFRDFAVISFVVSECPPVVIALSSRAPVGSAVAVTGYPMSSPSRTLTQNANCSLSGNGSPCLVSGSAGPGYSGGPITARDGSLVSVFSSFGNGTLLGDSLRSIMESMARLCRERKIPDYHVGNQKISCL